MKNLAQIIFIFLSGIICAQTNSLSSAEKLFLVTNFSSDNSSQIKTAEDDNSHFEIDLGKKDELNDNHLRPAPPILTSNAHDLEICTGNSAYLTASSAYTILWYTTPPPIGSPVGTGTSYITPQLSTGYYTYYAVAENNGAKSAITAMEVVMVYPNPTLSIVSNVNNLCANETATLTVSGTTYFEWENGPVASKITIRPSTTQSYKVTGINTAGCKSTAIYTQLVSICDSDPSPNTNKLLTSAVELNNEEHLFSVFPNPNNGEFNIRANVISENTRVEIYNSLGALTYSDKITAEISAVTLKDYTNGIYIVRIIENDKILKQEKIIKE